MFVPRLGRSLLLTVEEIAYARACCSSYELALRPLHPACMTTSVVTTRTTRIVAGLSV
jgi:hypothetical protein